MGQCLSCRRRASPSERDPLLQRERDSEASPTLLQVDRITSVLAALRAGKLPSQEQLNRSIQVLLRNSAVESGAYGALSDSGRKAIGDLREILEAILQIGLEKNSDDKLQNLLFQCQNIDPAQIHADIAVDSGTAAADFGSKAYQELPSSSEADADAKKLLGSLLTLGRVLLTSSTFRLLLSDFLLTFREIVADTAGDIGRVASRVEAAAENVQQAARPDGETFEDVKGKIKESAQDVSAEAGHDIQVRWEELSTEQPERLKEVVVARLQETMLKAHQDPAYQQGLQTILFLLRKYAQKANHMPDALSDAQAPVITPVVWIEPPVMNALSDTKILLERLASGHSLDPLLQSLSSVISDIATLPAELTSDTDTKQEIRAYFSSLGAWLDKSLTDYRYPTSREGQREAEGLYDQAAALFDTAKQTDAEWLHHTRALLRELDDFTSALNSDRSTQRLLTAMDAFSTHLAAFTSSAVSTAPTQIHRAQREWRRQIQGDIVVWLVPRLLRIVKVIPMPRVEYVSNAFEAAIDALFITASRTASSAAASLVPDRIRIASYSELQVHVVEEGDALLPGPSAAGAQAYSRVRVHVDGVRVMARDIGYYVRYKGWWSLFGYEDQGLLSVEVGERQARGRGLSVDVELEFEGKSDFGATRASGIMQETETDTQEERLFRVVEVKVDVPGLHFSIDRSKHWVLNKLLVQPLSAPVVRALAGNVLAQQITTSLESISRLSAQVKQTAEEIQSRNDSSSSTGPSYEDYWTALLHTLSGPSTEESSTQDEPEAHVETNTTVTLTGIVRTTVADGHSPSTPRTQTSSSPNLENESALAIGVAPQLLPGKGGPADLPRARTSSTYGAVDVAREALGEVQARVEGAEEGVQQAAEAAREMNGVIERGVEREEVEERGERKRSGWRSGAFDI